MGSYSLLHNTIGSCNTAIGFFSNQTNTTGSNNSSTGYQALDKNTTGNNNCAFGYWALSNNTNGSSYVCLGSAAGQSIMTTVGSSCIGANSDTSFNYSTSIGSNSVCTADHQITLGTANESVVVPGNLSVTGSINNISKTVFGYLSNASSNIQSQINTMSTNLASIGNNPLVLSSTSNVSGLAIILTQVQINTSLSVLQNISFTGTLNKIAAGTFSYLSGLTSNIQNQINAINNVSPVGSVISYICRHHICVIRIPGL